MKKALGGLKVNGDGYRDEYQSTVGADGRWEIVFDGRVVLGGQRAPFVRSMGGRFVVDGWSMDGFGRVLGLSLGGCW